MDGFSGARFRKRKIGTIYDEKKKNQAGKEKLRKKSGKRAENRAPKLDIFPFLCYINGL